jgi:hypothetical protein
VTITCPTCRQVFPVPTEVLGTDGHHVIVRMDRTELYGHLEQCAGQTAERQAEAEQQVPSKAVARPPIAQPHDVPPFIAKGRRTCVMCGATNEACMASLANSVPCCPSCGEGDTHPAPGER